MIALANEKGSPQVGLFAFVPPGEEKHRIGRMESKNFEPFVGRLMGRTAAQKKKAIQLNGLDQLLAEREGFEPSVGYSPTLDFESSTFNHSATSPAEDAHYMGVLAVCKTKNAGFSYGRSDLAGKPARTRLAGGGGGHWPGQRRPIG